MSLNHATPVAPPPGHDLARSGANFVLTATAAQGATIAQTGMSTGSLTNVQVTHTRDSLRALALYLLACAD